MGAKQMTAGYRSRCAKCPVQIQPGDSIFHEKGRSWHVTCPTPAAKSISSASPTPSQHTAAPTVSVETAPFEVWERWEPCKRIYHDQRLAAEVGVTRRYEKKLPALRQGATGTPEPGVYVVVGAGAWRYQNAEDNEDMGDMQGANWSGPLYLRRATDEEAEADAQHRLKDMLTGVFASLAAFANRAERDGARKAMDEAALCPGYARVELSYDYALDLSAEEAEARRSSRSELWHGLDRDYSWIATWTWRGQVVYQAHTYVYDWDLPDVYVGPVDLVERAAVAQAVVGLGWALQRMARQTEKAAA